MLFYYSALFAAQIHTGDFFVSLTAQTKDHKTDKQKSQ